MKLNPRAFKMMGRTMLFSFLSFVFGLSIIYTIFNLTQHDLKHAFIQAIVSAFLGYVSFDVFRDLMVDFISSALVAHETAQK